MGLELSLMRGMDFCSVICNVVYLNNMHYIKKYAWPCIILARVVQLAEPSNSWKIVYFRWKGDFSTSISSYLRRYISLLVWWPLGSVSADFLPYKKLRFRQDNYFLSIFFCPKKIKHNFAHGNSNANILPLVKPLEAHLTYRLQSPYRTLSFHHGRMFLSACISQINICPYFPREDVFPVSYYLTFLLPPWF